MKFTVDSTIMVKDKEASGNSRILKGFKPPFTAEVVQRAIENGFELAGQTNTSEFAISNLDKDEEIQGDCLSVLSKGVCEAALCNDYSGLVRRKIKKGCYIQPTYGTVSRYGLISCMSSSDQIGVAARDIDTGFKTLKAIAGHDAKDGTSYPNKSYEYSGDMDISKMHIGIAENIEADVYTEKAIDTLKKAGADAAGFKLPYAELLPQIQFIISCGEISNNINRFDGVKYGCRAEGYRGVEDMYTKTRTEALGIDAKLSSVMGALVLSEDYYEKYYDKALKLRGLFAAEFAKVFEEFDAVILPQRFENKTNYENSLLTAPAALAGTASLTINGVQIISKVFGESILYSIGKKLQGEGKA